MSCPSGFLWWFSLHSHDGLSNQSWPLVMELNLQSPAPPPALSQGAVLRKVRPKSSKSLITWLVLWATSSNPWVGSGKSHLIIITKVTLIVLYTQEIPRDRGAVSQEVWMKTKYVINHNISASFSDLWLWSSKEGPTHLRVSRLALHFKRKFRPCHFSA